MDASAAIDQDLGIYGDAAVEFIAALSAEFGKWVDDWPWERFVDFHEPAARILPRIWRLMKLPDIAMAFPGIAQERLELGHVAMVLETGQWSDP